MSELLKQPLASGLAQLGVSATEQQLQQLLDYLELLHKWNRAYNLTAIKDPREMLALHLLDSLSIAPHLHGERFIDVGTGPGLPGIPLAILFPQRHFTLLDSNGKRVRFLFQAKQTLQLGNIEEVQSRVEHYQPEKGYQGVISRAFASLEDMLQSCEHLLAADGHYYAMKGRHPDQELSQLPKKYMVSDILRLAVPGVDAERHLIQLTLS